MLTQLWENPIFVRARQVEARRLGSGLHSFLCRFGGALLLVFGPLAVTMFFTAGELLMDPTTWVTRWLGGVVGFTAFLGILYVTMKAASATAGAISLEKEQKTYECLLATRLRSDEVLAGKLAASLWPVCRELLAAAPLALALGIISGHALQSGLFMVPGADLRGNVRPAGNLGQLHLGQQPASQPPGDVPGARLHPDGTDAGLLALRPLRSRQQLHPDGHPEQPDGSRLLPVEPVQRRPDGSLAVELGRLVLALRCFERDLVGFDSA